MKSLGPAPDPGLWFKGFEQTYLERDIRGIEDPLGFRRLIKSPKFYMSDSGLACHLAGVAQEALLRSFPSYGALFETYAWNNLAAILAAHRRRPACLLGASKAGTKSIL